MSTRSNTKLLVLAGIFTTLTALGAFIKIPFPVVPLTMQTFFTMLAALVLPPQAAALSQIAYLILGLSGLPVFAYGGGFGYILQPTFGYLAALPVSAFLISSLLRRKGFPGSLYLFFVFFSGLLIILITGTVWLFFNLSFLAGSEISIQNVLFSGMLLFLPGTLTKAIVLTLIARRLI